MTRVDDGGPAFPSAVLMGDEEGSCTVVRSGISLRAWFAGKAMEGMLSAARSLEAAMYIDTPAALAEAAVKQADAMLVALRGP